MLQLLRREKTGLLSADAASDGKCSVITLRLSGRRLLREARETAATICAEADCLRGAASPQ